MGSRSESPPLPLFWAEDRKVPERKVTARPVVKKPIAHVMETEKPLSELVPRHLRSWDPAAHPPKHALTSWIKEEAFSNRHPKRVTRT